MLDARPPTLPATARLFVAAWPAPEVARAFARRRDASVDTDAAAVADARIHLTLHFLGAIERARMPALIDALDVPIAPFTLTFSNVTSWHGGLVVMTADTIPDPLRRLHAALTERLHAQSIATEARAFRPHVTLARHAKRRDADTPVSAVQWTIDSFVLVESRPGRGGGYDTVARYPRDVADARS